MTVNELVMYGLLLFGLFLFMMDAKMWFAPQKKGRVVAVEDQLGRAECDCSRGTIRDCRSHIRATVRTEDGELVQTDVSPCMICMDKVRLGSQIGLHRIGDRWIGRRYIDLLGRGLKNDGEPFELEACPLTGVAE